MSLYVNVHMNSRDCLEKNFRGEESGLPKIEGLALYQDCPVFL